MRHAKSSGKHEIGLYLVLYKPADGPAGKFEKGFEIRNFWSLIRAVWSIFKSHQHTSTPRAARRDEETAV